MTTASRDAILRTGADVVGVVLTFSVIALSEFLRGDWLLLPALYWSVLMASRLAAAVRHAPPGERETNARP